jgi:DnaJ-class molecular chaperone
MTLCELLGVPTTCTDDELKAAYRKKCRELHPDTNGGDEQKTKLFISMKEAYEKTIKHRMEARIKPPEVPQGFQGFQFYSNMGTVNVKWTFD